jgi:hypothetical protein
MPKGVNKYSNKPKGVMMAVLGISSGATGIWWSVSEERASYQQGQNQEYFAKQGEVLTKTGFP